MKVMNVPDHQRALRRGVASELVLLKKSFFLIHSSYAKTKIQGAIILGVKENEKI